MAGRLARCSRPGSGRAAGRRKPGRCEARGRRRVGVAHRLRTGLRMRLGRAISVLRTRHGIVADRCRLDAVEEGWGTPGRRRKACTRPSRRPVRLSVHAAIRPPKTPRTRAGSAAQSARAIPGSVPAPSSTRCPGRPRRIRERRGCVLRLFGPRYRRIPLPELHRNPLRCLTRNLEPSHDECGGVIKQRIARKGGADSADFAQSCCSAGASWRSSSCGRTQEWTCPSCRVSERPGPPDALPRAPEGSR